MADGEVKIKSLGKALRVLDCLVGQDEMGVTEIGEALGLGKSNVCDILSTFEAFGYVHQSQRSGKYRLGYRVLELSHALSSSLGFRRTVYPHIKRLADSINETVYLGVPDDFDVIYLDAAYPGHESMTRSMLGDRAPMYCTGIGKAILSRLPEEKWQLLAGQPLKSYTASTITSGEKLIGELKETRERGYSIDNMEHEYGIRCVGVPLLNSQGAVVAGLSISGPSLRMDDARIEEYAGMLRAVAGELQPFAAFFGA